MKEKRDKYIAHVTKMLSLLGQPPEKAAEDAKKIMHRQLKFRCRLLEIRALFQQRLCEVGRAIGEFL